MILDFIRTWPEIIIVSFGLLVTCLFTMTGVWIKDMKTNIEGHIKREEEGTWPKIDARFEALQSKMLEVREESLTRHVELVREVSELKNRTPNGEIHQIKYLLETLLNKVAS